MNFSFLHTVCFYICDYVVYSPQSVGFFNAIDLFQGFEHLGLCPNFSV